MMTTRCQTLSSVVGNAPHATTLSSASLRWSVSRSNLHPHHHHHHCHRHCHRHHHHHHRHHHPHLEYQCGEGEVRNMSSPTECQEAPQFHLDYSNPWFADHHHHTLTMLLLEILSRALGALFFAVIGLLMTAVAVAVLWRFWETPVSSASQFPICFISLTSHLILYVSFQDQPCLTLYRLCARVAGNSPASSSSAPSSHSVLRGEEKVLFTHF